MRSTLITVTFALIHAVQVDGFDVIRDGIIQEILEEILEEQVGLSTPVKFPRGVPMVSQEIHPLISTPTPHPLSPC